MKLAQHIYTSRYSFETVAQSPGLDRTIKRELENHAARYPKGQRTGTPPLVYRGFPLAGGELGAAVMAVYSSGLDLSGREGNYLAHSFIISREDLDQVGWNLPWISVQMPFWFDYEPPPPGEIGQLAPFEVAIDEYGPFDFTRFLLALYGEPDVKQIASQLLRHLEQTQDEPSNLNLRFPEASPQAVAGAVAEALSSTERKVPVPAPDVLNLWLMVGLVQLFPTKFRALFAYSLNEVSGSSPFLVSLKRGDTGPPPTDQDPVIYLGRICRLIHNFKDTTAYKALNNLNRLLKRPSEAGLECIYRYFTHPLRSKVKKAASSEDLIQLLQEISGANEDVHLDEIHNQIFKDILRNTSPQDITISVADNLMQIHHRSGASNAGELANICSAAIISAPGTTMDRRTFYCSLPSKVKEKVWLNAAASSALPAALSHRDNWSLEELKFFAKGLEGTWSWSSNRAFHNDANQALWKAKQAWKVPPTKAVHPYGFCRDVLAVALERTCRKQSISPAEALMEILSALKKEEVAADFLQSLPKQLKSKVTRSLSQICEEYIRSKSVTETTLRRFVQVLGKKDKSQLNSLVEWIPPQDIRVESVDLLAKLAEDNRLSGKNATVARLHREALLVSAGEINLNFIRASQLYLPKLRRYEEFLDRHQEAVGYVLDRNKFRANPMSKILARFLTLLKDLLRETPGPRALFLGASYMTLLALKGREMKNNPRYALNSSELLASSDFRQEPERFFPQMLMKLNTHKVRMAKWFASPQGENDILPSQIRPEHIISMMIYSASQLDHGLQQSQNRRSSMTCSYLGYLMKTIDLNCKNPPFTSDQAIGLIKGVKIFGHKHSNDWFVDIKAAADRS